MARTIHDTWGVAQRAEEADWSDDAIPEAIAKEMRRNWLRQQSLRESERRLRRQGALPPQPVDPAFVPIVVEHEAPHAFHAVTEQDIRGVLHRLPPGSLDGLQSVRLCFGEARAKELVAGVHPPSPLGSYDPTTAVIRVCAWFCDGEVRAPIALLLKVQSLATLVHEAAHHFDHAFRKRRNRWDVNDKSKHESWAERIQREQAAEVVLPWVRQQCSSEIEELERWLVEHAGAAREPLELIYYNPGPFVRLVRSVDAREDRDAARTRFASRLHRIGHNDYACAVVADVLASRPDDAAALAVRACVLQCEAKDHAAAEALGRRAVTLDPTCIDAWDVLARGYAIRGMWEQAALACESALRVTPREEPPRWYFVATLAEAHLHLGDWSAAADDIARMRAWGEDDWADMHAVLLFCWSERWGDALREATRLLPAEDSPVWSLWLAAARFESAQRLGLPDQAGRFEEARLSRLESSPFTEKWAQRIRTTLP